MIGYVKYFESNKAMSFKISDNKLLKTYNQIWKTVKHLLSIKPDVEPVFDANDKYIKTKIKLYDVNTNFQREKVAKENGSQKCLLLIILDFIVNVKKNNYPQTLLEESKY